MYLLDTSALVSLFLNDIHSARIASWIAQHPSSLLTSDWSSAEFAAVVSRYVRSGEIPEASAASVMLQFDSWRATVTRHADTAPAAVEVAETFIRTPHSKLSAPDALHLAIAQIEGAALVTFDDRQAAAAQALGVACIVPP